MENEFVRAAVWDGDLVRAEEIRGAHPEVERGMFGAAVLGDEGRLRELIAEDAARVKEKGGPFGCEPLVMLCFSKYLRLRPERGEEFVRCARVLLDAGADANAGFRSTGQWPEWETALYGAAGVAQHEGLTRLLVERGADVNDGEVTYHSPETHELGALKVLVETGKLTAASLVVMLVRKHDCHDEAGVRYLLEHGADPNARSMWGWTALEQAVKRDNAAGIVRLLLEHGADPTKTHQGPTAMSLAARRGRGDLLTMFRERGFEVELAGVEGLIAACALGDADAAREIAGREPGLARELVDQGGARLAEFAGAGNAAGVGVLLDLGVPVDALYGGDGYFEVPPGSTALQVAAWRARHDVVRLLIERGAKVEARDAKWRTALMLAVKACVDSYWMGRRSAESVRALLAAGASLEGVRLPCGYDEVDVLLAAR